MAEVITFLIALPCLYLIGEFYYRLARGYAGRWGWPCVCSRPRPARKSRDSVPGGHSRARMTGGTRRRWRPPW